MICQFEAEKCLHAASTDNLVIMIIDKGLTLGDPLAIQLVQILGAGLKVGAKPRGLPRGDVGTWNLLMHYVFTFCIFIYTYTIFYHLKLTWLSYLLTTLTVSFSSTYPVLFVFSTSFRQST